MVIEPIIIEIDHAQERLDKIRRICTVVSGLYEPESKSVKRTSGWSNRIGSVDAGGELSTWVDPITGTLMLRPAPLSKLWDTTSTGIFTRYAKTDYTFADSADWHESNDSGGASKFVGIKDSALASTDRWALTSSTIGRNRGVYMALLTHGWNGSKHVALSFGWGASYDPASGVTGKLYADGVVEIYKAGALIESGSIVGEGDKAQQLDGRLVGLFVIPMRKRELLIYSTLGGGFVTVFEDILETASDPEIVPDSKFWWRIDTGAGSVEFQALKFPSSGWRASIISEKVDPPLPSQEQGGTKYANEMGGAVTLSVREVDGTTAFTANGLKTRFRARADLTAGDSGNYSPLVYGALVEWGPLAVMTDEDTLDITNKVLSASFEHSEHPGSYRWDLILKAPEEIDPGNWRGLTTILWRPIRIRMGEDLCLFDGYVESVKVIDAVSDEATRLHMTCVGVWHMLEQARFRDDTPLDTLEVRDAIELVAGMAGMGPDGSPGRTIVVSDSAATLQAPEGTGSRADWAVCPKVGDDAAQWLDRLHEDYIANWYMGERPAINLDRSTELWIKSPEDMGEEANLTLYASTELAMTVGGYGEHDAWRHVYHSRERDQIPAECNEINITGLDTRTRRPILYRKVYEEAMDATADVYSRVEDWAGEVKPYGFTSPHLNTIEECEKAAELLAERLFYKRIIHTITAELLIDPVTLLPIWTGDCINIHEDDNITKWRVVNVRGQIELTNTVAFDASSEADTLTNGTWRPVTYVLQQIRDEVPDSKGLGFKGLTPHIPGLPDFTAGPMMVREKRVVDRQFQPVVSARLDS